MEKEDYRNMLSELSKDVKDARNEGDSKRISKSMTNLRARVMDSDVRSSLGKKTVDQYAIILSQQTPNQNQQYNQNDTRI
ncbi:MAG: hypothetical protein WDZ69_01455 [Candidatus Pacearchaeota archaeon]